jgi:hypothetical protein
MKQLQTSSDCPANAAPAIVATLHPRLHCTDGSTYFTPQQVAKRWAWHVESVRRAIRQRRLASVILSRRRLVPIAEIERLEAAGRINAVQ